jgi:inner membrane protein
MVSSIVTFFTVFYYVFQSTFIKKEILVFRFYFFSSCIFSFLLYIFQTNHVLFTLISIFSFVIVLGMPALLILYIQSLILKASSLTYINKSIFYIIGLVLLDFIYSMAFGQIVFYEASSNSKNLIIPYLYFFLTLGLSVSISAALLSKRIKRYLDYSKLSTNKNLTIQNNKSFLNMENQLENEVNPFQTKFSNRISTKAGITLLLILLTLVPTFFISNLVNERKNRYRDVVEEISQKWSKGQTISSPYISVPYTQIETDEKGKKVNRISKLILLSQKTYFQSKLQAEPRKRSIYEVLTYRSSHRLTSKFTYNIPQNRDLANIDFSKAKVCIDISDYKGIEETKSQINGIVTELEIAESSTPLGNTTLSAPLSLDPNQLKAGLLFSLELNLKGTENLNFIAAGQLVNIDLKSSWPNPSFIGNHLPQAREINQKGFAAVWKFNKANMPFPMVFDHNLMNTIYSNTVGVNLIQSVNSYDKTDRSLKYAILIIGLSFGLFFITEITQKNHLHPVQYVLIGLALLVFYTLLLSISEYTSFNISYLIASVATVGLISIYLHAHFKKISSTALFTGVLAGLYVFVFILINLEDTALLLGSIGLFTILSLVMYYSRKVNWTH